MFVLGIDPGLTATGYGLVRKTADGLRAGTMGVIRTDRRKAPELRLRELHDDLTGLLAEAGPAIVAIEQVFVNKNRLTATAVGRASGVAMLVAAQAGVPVFEYTPTAVKSAVAGYGKAPKDQIKKMVAQRLALSALPEPADAADALAVAICHLQSGLAVAG